jgi:transposase
MELSAFERAELAQTARRGQPAHVRVKALAILALYDGRKVGAVADIFRVSRQALSEWRRRYRDAGVAGLQVRPGRGRRSSIDLEVVRDTVRRSPREFGLARTRWTLGAVAHAVPGLAGYSPRGVQKVLARAGLSYKRGQAWVHSPDPYYGEKKQRSMPR